MNAVATKPVWAKMTPNITDITVPAKAALGAGECCTVGWVNGVGHVIW